MTLCEEIARLKNLKGRSGRRPPTPGTTKADSVGKRRASTKDSTPELAIKMNNSCPLTVQGTGSVYMAVQQNKALGMVANTMTIPKLVKESKTSRVALKMIAEPMVYQPIGVGMKEDEPACSPRSTRRCWRWTTLARSTRRGTSGSAPPRRSG